MTVVTSLKNRVPAPSVLATRIQLIWSISRDAVVTPFQTYRYRSAVSPFSQPRKHYLRRCFLICAWLLVLAVVLCGLFFSFYGITSRLGGHVTSGFASSDNGYLGLGDGFRPEPAGLSAFHDEQQESASEDGPVKLCIKHCQSSLVFQSCRCSDHCDTCPMLDAYRPEEPLGELLSSLKPNECLLYCGPDIDDDLPTRVSCDQVSRGCAFS